MHSGSLHSSKVSSILLHLCLKREMQRSQRSSKTGESLKCEAPIQAPSCRLPLSMSIKHQRENREREREVEEEEE